LHARRRSHRSHEEGRRVDAKSSVEVTARDEIDAMIGTQEQEQVLYGQNARQTYVALVEAIASVAAW
jgi:hypothetical protein